MKKDELLPRGRFLNREDYEAYLKKHLDVEGLLSDATEVATKRVSDFLKDDT